MFLKFQSKKSAAIRVADVGAPALPSTAVCCPQDAANLLQDFAGEEREFVWAILLDGRRKPIEIYLLSVGTASQSLVHPRELFRGILSAPRPAASFILAHNHPTGNPEPSSDDWAMTERICKAGDLLGIECADHIVIAQDSEGSLKFRSLRTLESMGASPLRCWRQY